MIVISYRAWQRQFGGDENIVGRKLIEPATQVEFTIIGVAPAGLDYPSHADDWEAELPGGARAQQLIVARLAPGVSPHAAADEYFNFVKQLEHQGYGANTFVGAEALPFASEIEDSARPVLLTLSAAVALLLVIACVNVGNLLLLRATGRARELSIRRALGATYGRLVRQLAVESVLLAVIAGALGLVLAAVLLKILIIAAPAELPRLDLVRLDGHTLAIALGVTTVAAILFGVLPTTSAARADLATPLRAGSRTGTTSRSRRATHRSLVVSQVALALVLVVNAGLLARSLQRLQRIHLGYSTDHLSFFSVSYPGARYDTPPKELALGDALYKRLSTVPGVRSITPVIQPPFHGPDFYINKLAVDGQSDSEGDARPFVPWEAGSAEYFQTFGIPILEGRGFRDSDDANAEQVVVISDALARALFPGQSAIGHHIRRPSATERGPCDGRSSVSRATRTIASFDSRRRWCITRFARWPGKDCSPFGRRGTSRPGAPAGTAARGGGRRIRRVHRNAQTMDDMLAGSLSRPRLSALLLTGFGVAALLLAAIGMYGVMTGSVRERTRLARVRLALGATPEDLRLGVLRQSMTLTFIGIALGTAVALGTTRLLRAVLYDVSPTDPVVIVGVVVVLAVVGALAAYIPARRATQFIP